MTTVYKPWGREEWLELNDKYCYKRIYINAGHRTSYQYHQEKLETNFIIAGQAEVWLEDENGEIQISTMNAGDYFTVIPPRKHRVIAITDIILQEVSTPEVDDVVRIEDDAHRQDGVIAHEKINPALCILAAGKGTRLDYLAEKTHKGLLPLQNKAIISHIIDKTPDYFDVVIAVGHKASMVEEYCRAAHPNRNFIFVYVDNYDGIDSGPGTSFLACAKDLQRPFYLSTADCLVDEPLPSLEHNWFGVAPTGIPELYSTVAFSKTGQVFDIQNKSIDGYDHAFIGLCGIRDYDVFIRELKSQIENGELISAFADLTEFHGMSAEIMTWHDVGTIDGYIAARTRFSNDAGLEKITNECFYKVNGRIIKSNSDGNIVKNIIARAKKLAPLTPPLVFAGEYVYAYDFVPGKSVYEYGAWVEYNKCLNWLFRKLPQQTFVGNNDEAKSFYLDKTMVRVLSYLKTKPSSYQNESWVVNDIECLSIFETLANVNWNQLFSTRMHPYFHGDLQFDNIIYGDGKFTLIDWRESFAGNDEFGDLYYDLAKLYGGICMNYHLMKDWKNYKISVGSNNVKYWWDNGKGGLDLIKKEFGARVGEEGYDMKRVMILTALIYLNMAPLHPGDMGDILFFHGLKELQNVS